MKKNVKKAKNRLKKLRKCFKVSDNVQKLLKTHKTLKNALVGPTDGPTGRRTDKVTYIKLRARD